jgi:hypothetical protein
MFFGRKSVPEKINNFVKSFSSGDLVLDLRYRYALPEFKGGLSKKYGPNLNLCYRQFSTVC